MVGYEKSYMIDKWIQKHTRMPLEDLKAIQSGINSSRYGLHGMPILYTLPYLAKLQVNGWIHRS